MWRLALMELDVGCTGLVRKLPCRTGRRPVDYGHHGVNVVAVGEGLLGLGQVHGHMATSRLHSLRLAPPTQQKGTKWLRGYSKVAANKHENNLNPNRSHLDLKRTRWLNLCCWSKSTCLV